MIYVTQDSYLIDSKFIFNTLFYFFDKFFLCIQFLFWQVNSLVYGQGTLVFTMWKKSGVHFKTQYLHATGFVPFLTLHWTQSDRWMHVQSFTFNYSILRQWLLHLTWLHLHFTFLLHPTFIFCNKTRYSTACSNPQMSAISYIK